MCHVCVVGLNVVTLLRSPRVAPVDIDNDSPPENATVSPQVVDAADIQRAGGGVLLVHEQAAAVLVRRVRRRRVIILNLCKLQVFNLNQLIFMSFSHIKYR